MEDFKTSTCIAVISDRHLSPPTLCIYPALATRHGICNRHEPACQIGGKVQLPREQNSKYFLNRTNMDATASCSTSREVRPAPSGDYVLLPPSGDYNRTMLGITFSRTFKNIAINSRTFKGT